MGRLEISISQSNDGEVSIDIFENNLNSNYFAVVERQHFEHSIVPKLFEADPTIKRALQRGRKFRWQIKEIGSGVASQRLRHFVPRVVFPKFLSNKLYSYQSEGVEWLISENKRILADDMGLGKTVQVLIAIQHLYFNDEIQTAVLFAPNSLIPNWLKEAKFWAPSLEIKQIGSSEARDPQLMKNRICGANLLLAPYSLAGQIVTSLRKIDTEIDVIVCDEAHKLRKSKSQTNKAIASIKSKRTWLLTGTPLERDEEDIVNLLSILEPAKFGHGQLKQKVWLHSALKRLSLRREKADVLGELPDVERIVHELTLSAPQMQNYARTAAEVLRLEAHERISNITRLAIATSITVQNENTKAEKMLEIVFAAIERHEKTIIFSNFNQVLADANTFLRRSSINGLLFTGETEGQERFQILQKFNNDEAVKVLLLNSKVGSEGLTLTKANNVIFLNEWWNPSSNRQAEDRVNRIGQQKPVNIHILRAKDTIDVRIANIIEGKTQLESEFLDELTKGH